MKKKMIRSNTTRQHVLSMRLTVALAGRAGPPGTQAGRRAKAFFMAFNSGNDGTMRSFESQHRAKSVLERRSMDDRIEQYHELSADWGDLEVDGVFDSKELELSIGVKPQVDVPASQALLAAHKAALGRILNAGLDGELARDAKAALRRVSADLESPARARRRANRTDG